MSNYTEGSRQWRRYNNPKPGAKSQQSKLAKQVKKNTRILNARELGRVRVVMDATPDTTAVVQNVSAVAEGDDVGNRHGRKIHAESIEVRGTIIKNTASQANGVRLLIFRDNLGTTTAPTLADLFTDENDFFQNQQRLINEQPMKRFTILWDKFFALNENFDGQTTMVPFSYHKKLNHNILYTGAAVTDEGKNSLWFMSGSDEVSNTPALRGDIVFKYTDL